MGSTDGGCKAITCQRKQAPGGYHQCFPIDSWCHWALLWSNFRGPAYFNSHSIYCTFHIQVIHQLLHLLCSHIGSRVRTLCTLALQLRLRPAYRKTYQIPLTAKVLLTGTGVDSSYKNLITESELSIPTLVAELTLRRSVCQ